MNLADRLIHEIRSTPDDDFPRLIYADYLDERGDPLGEVIRYQCALANTDRELDPEERQEMGRRCGVLMKAHQKRWRRPLDDLGAFRTKMDRGFVEHVNIALRVFLRNADKLFQAAPMLRSLQISGGWRLLPIKPLRRLMASRYLNRIERLDLSSNTITANGFQKIATGIHFQRLKTLNLNQTTLTDDGAKRLTQLTNIPTLEVLELRQNHLTQQGQQSLQEQFGDRVKTKPQQLLSF